MDIHVALNDLMDATEMAIRCGRLKTLRKMYGASKAERDRLRNNIIKSFDEAMYQIRAHEQRHEREAARIAELEEAIAAYRRALFEALWSRVHRDDGRPVPTLSDAQIRRRLREIVRGL